jgi:hypothetical protein
MTERRRLVFAMSYALTAASATSRNCTASRGIIIAALPEMKEVLTADPRVPPGAWTLCFQTMSFHQVTATANPP